jgi:AcrR family transcriptional regulator
MAALRDIALRERKYARTKLTLFNAAIKRLVDRPFEAISVKELCDEALVSEATFFNYFPRKTDLLVYYMQLWSIDVAWHAQKASNGKGGIRAIEAIFHRTAERARIRPRVICEIIAFLARQRDEFTMQPVSMAERLMAFPDWEGVETLPDDGFHGLVQPNLNLAMELGELPADTDLRQANIAMRSIFFGVPLALGHEHSSQMEEIYRGQLDLLWAGLRAGH